MLLLARGAGAVHDRADVRRGRRDDRVGVVRAAVRVGVVHAERGAADERVRRDYERAHANTVGVPRQRDRVVEQLRVRRVHVDQRVEHQVVAEDVRADGRR